MKNSKQESFWVLRAQAGDKEAFNNLLTAVQTPLYRYIYRMVGRHSPAEDILQEVFIIIYRKIGWLENPRLFPPWAYRIASREAFRHLKTEKRWAPQASDEELLETIPFQPPDPVYETELIEKLPALVFQLSPASRAVLILHYLHNLPLSEIADILSVASGTVKSRLAYGLETLRRQINKKEYGKDVE